MVVGRIPPLSTSIKACASIRSLLFTHVPNHTHISALGTISIDPSHFHTIEYSCKLQQQRHLETSNAMRRKLGSHSSWLLEADKWLYRKESEELEPALAVPLFPIRCNNSTQPRRRKTNILNMEALSLLIIK